MAGTEHEIVVISAKSKNITQKYSFVKLQKNSEMIKELCAAMDVPSDVISVLDENKSFKLEVLKKGNKQYHDLCNIFRGTSKEWFSSLKFSMEYVHMVLNPYLFAQYQLKMLRKRELFGLCNDTMLFHGTKIQDVTSICKENFNWRLVKTHLFGKGISFAQYAKYASYYPKYVDSDLRAIIMSMVSYTNKCDGTEDMVIPPFSGYDTAVKPENEDVWVKFEDAECLPVCVFYYKNNASNENAGNSSQDNIANINTYQQFQVDVSSIFKNTVLDINDSNVVVIK